MWGGGEERRSRRRRRQGGSLSGASKSDHLREPVSESRKPKTRREVVGERREAQRSRQKRLRLPLTIKSVLEELTGTVRL